VLGISLHRFSIRPHFNYAVKGLIAKYSRIVFNAQDDGANGEAAVLPVPPLLFTYSLLWRAVSKHPTSYPRAPLAGIDTGGRENPHPRSECRVAH
jgi:hypothetical protein